MDLEAIANCQCKFHLELQERQKNFAGNVLVEGVQCYLSAVVSKLVWITETATYCF